MCLDYINNYYNSDNEYKGPKFGWKAFATWFRDTRISGYITNDDFELNKWYTSKQVPIVIDDTSEYLAGFHVFKTLHDLYHSWIHMRFVKVEFDMEICDGKQYGVDIIVVHKMRLVPYEELSWREKVGVWWFSDDIRKYIRPSVTKVE